MGQTITADRQKGDDDLIPARPQRVLRRMARRVVELPSPPAYRREAQQHSLSKYANAHRRTPAPSLASSSGMAVSCGQGCLGLKIFFAGATAVYFRSRLASRGVAHPPRGIRAGRPGGGRWEQLEREEVPVSPRPPRTTAGRTSGSHALLPHLTLFL